MNRRDVARLTAAFLLSASAAVAQSAEPAKIAITYIVDHPAINAAQQGIVDALAEGGYTEGETLSLTVQSAQGSMPTQMQIAQDFAGRGADLLVGISTPSAQALQSAAGDNPVLFSAVTDPVAAKLVASLDAPGANITGTTDKQPFEPTLELIRALVPEASTLGVIYNGGEANSVAQVEALKAVAGDFGFEIVEATAAQTAMVPDAALSLAGRADAILIPTDSTIVSAVESVVNVGQRAQIPVVASDTDSVERGAIAALGFDYYKLGVITGEMALRILGGEAPGTIPVGTLETQDLYLNTASASAMGVTIPDTLLSRATKVIE